MSQENVEIVRRGYEALAAGSLEAVLELLDRDIEIEIYTGRPDLPESNRLHGHSGFLQNLKQLTEAFDGIEVEPEEFIEAGDELIVVIRTAGHGKGSGIRVENRVIHVWTLRDGKATRFRVYGSKGQALEAVGLSEQDAHADS